MSGSLFTNAVRSALPGRAGDRNGGYGAPAVFRVGSDDVCPARAVGREFAVGRGGGRSALSAGRPCLLSIDRRCGKTVRFGYGGTAAGISAFFLAKMKRRYAAAVRACPRCAGKSGCFLYGSDRGTGRLHGRVGPVPPRRFRRAVRGRDRKNRSSFRWPCANDFPPMPVRTYADGSTNRAASVVMAAARTPARKATPKTRRRPKPETVCPPAECTMAAGMPDGYSDSASSPAVLPAT